MLRKSRTPFNPDSGFSSIVDTRMYWPTQRARFQVVIREGVQKILSAPIENAIFRFWEYRLLGSTLSENWCLPRRLVERNLNDSLTIYVNPRELIRIRDWRDLPKRRRPSSSAFIWDGDWDMRRGDLRYGSRYRFISDLMHSREDLTQSYAFYRFKTYIDEGRPWSSYHLGILLDSEERIHDYLSIYLGFIDDMALNGFDQRKGKDDIGVAVSRDGTLIKINRGLHRLAMAQYLGLPLVPVKVKAIHRQWWEEVTQHTRGTDALERVVQALQHCTPEQQPGPLDPHETPEHFSWPAKRV
ncbi:hypothetical protein LPL18_000345 [Halomonas sp. CUBES01]|uniref:ParB/Sulfiredoxin domain-containing protein n=1 Tax=Vreelandella gomseomensis TaxID=370766 RepID=A0ABU1GBN0_9GAMM|nr:MULTISPECIES: hypothetical protein [Halomonas]MDR5874410.1 hypothetical protein [Halomonas gomseomensis]MEC4765800.1 hypothetical protein [Halomonas sp. CUBES01]